MMTIFKVVNKNRKIYNDFLNYNNQIAKRNNKKKIH